MKSSPKIGSVGELQFTVETRHGIDFHDEIVPNILSTPHLIWFLENAAIVALEEHQEAHETSLGVHVDIQHLAPTPIGASVTCRARVIHVDRKLISFQVEAHDDRELVARGTHKRRVVAKQRFGDAIRKKM